MALPKIISKLGQREDNEKKEYLLAIEIWDGEVKSAIWTVEEGKTKVAALGSRETWSEKGELITAADQSLSQASERFSEIGQEPSKVIFGLPEKWTDEKEIQPEYRELLKEIYQKLELKPVGYVLTFDALIHHLRKVEGVPPSAILVKLAKDKLYLAVVEVGKKIGVEEVGRSQDLASDLREGLTRIEGSKTLPARILLFDSEDMESANQVLIAHPWLKPQPNGKKLGFLHLPKIEILPTDADINAVALAGGSEVAKSLGFEIKEEVEVKEKREAAEVLEDEETEPEEETEEEGVAKETPEVEEPSFAEASEGEEADFGFVKEKDIQEERPVVTAAEVEEKESLPGRGKAEEAGPKFSLPSLTNFFSLTSLKKIFTKIPLPASLSWQVIAIVVGGLGLALAGLLIALLWYLPQAEVTIFVEPKELEKEFSLTIDPNQEVVDQENRILPGRILEAEEEGEKSAETTGEKTVGEEAKGEVTVYNRTEDEKTFKEGTVISASGGLQFTLDQEIKIASKTPDLNTGVDKWGEAKTGVTAGEIGAQYNLAAGTQFSVDDYPTSSFLAKNESDLSGGTSRKIQAVSEEDMDELLSSLSKDLADKAEGGLLAAVPADLSLIRESILNEPTEEDFSHQDGEETQTLNLKLTVKIKALAFNRENFVKLVASLIADSVPGDYQLKEDEIESHFEVEEENEDGSLLFKTNIKVHLLPKLESAEIAKNIKGKYQNLAEDYFRTIPGYTRAEFKISPSLPGFLGTLPRREERIKVEIKSQ
jgi:hypothetical protein